MPEPFNNPIYTELRGKLGNWVYARNHWGPLRRPWHEHRTMSSPAQDTWRAINHVVWPRWNLNLTDQQRAAWRAFTEQYPKHDQLRQSYCPSGQNRWAGCNSISYAYGGVFLDDPPVDLHCHQPGEVTILIATASPQALTIHMEGTLDADEYWVLAAAPLTKPGRFNVCNLWRPLAFGSDALPYTFDALSDYTAKFTALIAGKKINVKFQIANVATGTISQSITAVLLVT
jgi:hypothetical protein